MSRLKDRIQRIKGSAAEPVENPSFVTAEKQQWEKFGAEEVHNEKGTFIQRVRYFDLQDQHGLYHYADLRVLLPYFSIISQGERVEDAGQILFFDTETTGLGMGAGNVPFMLGIGYMTNRHFVVEQWLMRNPGEEAAMLHAWSELLERFTHLVSYNGKSFDWSILQNRLVLHRLQKTTKLDIQHMDLLYPSRSLWRHTLPTCRLSDVEVYRLGIKRVEDVPGSLAPTLYFQYLNERKPEILEGVLSHNETDILSLATLLIHLAMILDGRVDETVMKPEELYRLAVWLDRMKQNDEAEKAWTLLCSLKGRRMSHYLEKAALRYKKRRNWEAAIELWQQCIEEYTSFNIQIQPYIELSMVLEHHQKNYKGALSYARQAKTMLWKQSEYGLKSRHHKPTEQRLVDKRIQRLEQKLACRQRKHNETLDYGTLF